MNLPVGQRVGPLGGRSVFMSAGVPDRSRWTGQFDARDITDATVSLIRSVVGLGGHLVFGGHPDITPLIAAEVRRAPDTDGPVVTLYQSAFFETDFPAEVQLLEESRRVRVVVTAAEPTGAPGVDASLDAMRLAMLESASHDFIAAFFIGGMHGIRLEYDLFVDLHPESPAFPVGAPRGASAALLERASQTLSPEDAFSLRDSRRYVSLFSRLLMAAAE